MEQRLCLKACYLDHTIYSHLLDTARERMVNFGDQEHGRIMEVRRIVRVNEQYISNTNSDIVFHVLMDVAVFNPRVGDHVHGYVYKILERGFFVCVHNYTAIFVPRARLSSSCVYDGYTYHVPATGRTYTVGTLVEVVIDTSLFVPPAYQYLATPIHD